MQKYITKLVWTMICFGSSIVSALASLVRIIGLVFGSIGLMIRKGADCLDDAVEWMLSRKVGKFERT